MRSAKRNWKYAYVNCKMTPQQAKAVLRILELHYAKTRREPGIHSAVLQKGLDRTRSAIALALYQAGEQLER